MSLREKVIEEYRKSYREVQDQIQVMDNPELQRYSGEYFREVDSYSPTPVSGKELNSKIKESQIIYVGDFHPLRRSKLSFRNLVSKGYLPQKATVLALEEFFTSEQDLIDAYLSGKIGPKELRARKANPKGVSFTGILKILDLAKEKNFHVHGLDQENLSLNQRDTSLAQKISGLYRLYENPQIFAFTGDFHISRNHLPQKVRTEISQRYKDLVIFQNEDTFFWKLMEKGIEHSAEIIRLGERDYGLNQIPPLLKALVYANSLEEKKDRSDSKEIMAEYANLVQEIIRTALELDDDLVEPVTVFSFMDKDLEEKIRESDEKENCLTPEEKKEMLKSAAEGRSFAIWKKAIIYLAEDNMEDIAEEVTHYLHFKYSGNSTTINNPVDFFYEIVITEALGFFGSKLLSPSRRPLTLKDINNKKNRSRMKRSVLLYQAQEKNPNLVTLAGLFGKLPRGEKEKELLAHYFGYRLGEKLYREVESGKTPLSKITTLFKTNLDGTCDALYQYYRLIRDFSG